MNTNNFSTNQKIFEEVIIPPLPNYAQLSPEKFELGQSQACWFDDYINFASEASPLTPNSLHQAEALFIGSLVIARRLYLPVSTTKIFPNLYMLFVGPSTKPRKTTGMRVGKGVLTEAGLDYLLLADRQTPEALSVDLSSKVPPDYLSMKKEDQEFWLTAHKFPSQRGLLLEEASHFLDSFNRDYTSGLLPIMLDLYDCPDVGPQRNTISRGIERINFSYISLFGSTTYGAIYDHLKIKTHWNNGLWARIAIVIDDGSGIWKFWPPPMNFPTDLVDRIKFIATELFPVPKAEIEEIRLEKGKRNQKEQNKYELRVTPLTPSEAIIDPTAYDQWERYSKATSFEMLDENNSVIPYRLQPNYGRLGTMLIKVAMILATFETDHLPVKVLPKHVFRAQIIVEGWRENLHKVLKISSKNETSSDNTRLKVLTSIALSKSDWKPRRDLLQELRLPMEKLNPIISKLIEDGIIEKKLSEGSRGPSSEEYRLNQSVEIVDSVDDI